MHAARPRKLGSERAFSKRTCKVGGGGGLSKLSTTRHVQIERRLCRVHFGPGAHAILAELQPWACTPSAFGAPPLPVSPDPGPPRLAPSPSLPRPRGTSLCPGGAWRPAPGAAPHPGGVAWAPSPPRLDAGWPPPRASREPCAASYHLQLAGRLDARVNAAAAARRRWAGRERGAQRARGGARGECRCKGRWGRWRGRGTLRGSRDPDRYGVEMGATCKGHTGDG